MLEKEQNLPEEQHIPKQKRQIFIEFKEKLFDNPVLLAVAVFSMIIKASNLLESVEARNFFNWCGYYFASFIVWLNSVIHIVFKDISIQNPITANVMYSLNPLMWLRSYFIGAATVGFIVTIIKTRYVKLVNIFFLSLLTGLFQAGLYLQPYIDTFATSFMPVMQKYYSNILVVIVITFISFLFGMYSSAYLFSDFRERLGKNGRNTLIKYMNEDDWNPN